ncbi:MAG: FHA domain-containing protein [Woeseiaceae bacterium]|nr:FHA domain-containing protein [Woeseiaceae bacterium]
MKCLVRFITRGAGGAVEHADKVIDTDSLTIGRATDQTLHVRDRRARLQHARIESRDGGHAIVTGALAGVTVNGRSQREATLAPGDEIEVGANLLRVIEPPAGIDFALSFELADDAGEHHLAPAWSAPVRTLAGFGKRRLSWLAAGVVVLLAFAIPALTLLGPGVAKTLRSVPLLPDDSVWLAGDVHRTHASVATECEACHARPFRRVPDAACGACHESHRHAAGSAPPVLGEMRCASCHLEHNEPPQLISEHQGLCGDCHADGPAGTDLPPASDFLDDHPPFRVSLSVPVTTAGTTEWQTERRLLEQARDAERSNLRFDHALHVDEDGVIGPDGRQVLACQDCHRPEPGGARMQPVRMDEHCSGCHELSFDPQDPSRTVPHGDPEGVLQVLIEYYSARLLGDDATNGAQQRLRRPGQALTRADRDRVAAEARAQALTVAADLFERRACVNCHEVTKVQTDAAMPWRVQPVRLTERFFPHARFSHAAHDTDVASCDGCHAASQSGVATDLLLPGMDSCRDCHRQRHRAAQRRRPGRQHLHPVPRLPRPGQAVIPRRVGAAWSALTCARRGWQPYCCRCLRLAAAVPRPLHRALIRRRRRPVAPASARTHQPVSRWRMSRALLPGPRRKPPRAAARQRLPSSTGSATSWPCFA